jgi:hypothetical protein
MRPVRRRRPKPSPPSVGKPETCWVSIITYPSSGAMTPADQGAQLCLFRSGRKGGVDQANHRDRMSSSKPCCSPGTSSASLAAATYSNQSRIVWCRTRAAWQ